MMNKWKKALKRLNLADKVTIIFFRRPKYSLDFKVRPNMFGWLVRFAATDTTEIEESTKCEINNKK